MIDLLAPEPGQAILDLAAGPGETGFGVAPRVLPGGTLVTSDVAPEMIEAARRRAADLGLANVRFAVEDAVRLTFEDAAFDGIVCRFGLMLVPDMERAAGEARRVVRTGGRVVFAVWASTHLNPWMTAAGRAAVELGFTGPPDRDAPGPFRLADAERFRAVVEAGGLTVLETEDVPVQWRAPSLDAWWETTRDTSRALSELLRRLGDEDAAALRRRAAELLAEFVAADGSVVVPGLARVLVATPL